MKEERTEMALCPEIEANAKAPQNRGNDITTDGPIAMNDYQLIGPSEDGVVSDLLEELRSVKASGLDLRTVRDGESYRTKLM